VGFDGEATGTFSKNLEPSLAGGESGCRILFCLPPVIGRIKAPQIHNRTNHQTITLTTKQSAVPLIDVKRESNR